MKKYNLFFALFLIGFVFLACDNGSNGISSDNDDETEITPGSNTGRIKIVNNSLNQISVSIFQNNQVVKAANNIPISNSAIVELPYGTYDKVIVNVKTTGLSIMIGHNDSFVLGGSTIEIRYSCDTINGYGYIGVY
jgi:hypothetical protein